jgi:predicted nucleic acid-binding protein
MIPVPKKIVIDTNVCLDLFVFNDPRWAKLVAAIESGAIDAVTRSDCRDEYNIVLHYKHLPLDDDSRPLAAARFDALIKVVAPPVSGVRCPSAATRPTRSSSKSRATPAPMCSSPKTRPC